jgi:hypothetical protein
MPQIPIDEITPEMAEGLAERFVEVARSVNCVELDYSVASLDDVDAIIEGMRKERLKVKDVYRVLLVAGCYVGEVIVRAKNLTWVRAEESSYADHKDYIPLVIRYGEGGFTSPIGKVIKRMQNGKEDYLPFYYDVLGEIMENPPGQGD